MAMWRPAARIRHDASAGEWPTAERAAASPLYAPLRVGNVVLEERTWVPAMVPWRAGPDGEVTPQVLAWYARFAQGQPGALVVEATGVRDVPSGPLLRIGDDRYRPGLAELTRRVREASHGRTRCFIQLIDFLRVRRRPDPGQYFARFLAITDRHRSALQLPGASDDAVRDALAALPPAELGRVLTPRELEALDRGARQRVTDVDVEEIARLPETLPVLFAAAAVRARECGFDGVELHYAHAYTMASFLSATNTRDDGYGGTLENRLRLPLEVYEAVRRAVGRDFVVGCRFLTDEIIDGGTRPDEAAQIGVALARAGMDFLSLSRGGKFDDALQPKVGQAVYPYTGPSGYECMPSYFSDAAGPFGRNLAPTRRVREAVRAAGHAVPVVAAGGIHNFEQAEAVLERGEGDIVGIARQALADPDWFRKVRSGRGAEVRLCLYTNYCEALDQRHREVTCELWDRLDLAEAQEMLAADGKRRLLPPAWRP
ncbi:MAG: NADH:flavin oxidoreductase [Steroidobacteraceae bacterium]|jgi:2,4-dienoyl-CoA reductase-like NADH-dependent reductase (Old Yellow Enzyme family)|nr:NADH:flavin oxidoreductase [Steroidobacteraceae bacterium]